MDFVERDLASQLKDMAKWFPVVSLTGPRQSGKSTLAQHVFPDYAYVNLEDPQIRTAAIEDPVSFIYNRPEHLIIDEAQYAPGLFSTIQVASDKRGSAGQYVLTGSQNFLMMKSIDQSLAGRVGLSKLLPLSFREIRNSGKTDFKLDDFMLKGGYPRLHASEIPPRVYFSSYVETYVERDVAELLDVRNKTSFRKLLAMCAQSAGKLLNVASLSNEIDVSAQTVRSWLSVLESSYIIFMLRPYHSNVRKRLVKTPKLYFYDTGLLCHLLRIETAEQLLAHPMIGSIFENLIIAETAKKHFNEGISPELYFYRDDSKKEIDLLDFTQTGNVQAVEIKSSRTYHSKYAKHLNSVCGEIGIAADNRCVVARVESSYHARECKVASAEDWLTA